MITRRKYLCLATALLGAAMIFLWPHRATDHKPHAIAARPHRSQQFLVDSHDFSSVKVMDAGPTGIAMHSDCPSTDVALAVISEAIQEWRLSQGRRPGNKRLEADAENRLTDDLPRLLSVENTPDIVQSLSSEELESPFGLAAVSRWMDQNPATAARWIAARQDSTDDQAWIVAQKLVEEPAIFETFVAEMPETQWKQEFLGYFAGNVISLDPILACDIAEQMNPSELRDRLIEQASE